MTHTSTEQPEALRLAECLERDTQMNWPDYDNQVGAAAELRSLHARVQELEATQAQRAPLSDERIDGINLFITGTVFGRIARGRAIARAVEAAHGITQENQG